MTNIWIETKTSNKESAYWKTFMMILQDSDPKSNQGFCQKKNIHSLPQRSSMLSYVYLMWYLSSHKDLMMNMYQL